MARRVGLALVVATVVLAVPARAQVWERAGLGAALLGRWAATTTFLGRISGEPTPAVRYFRGLSLLETGRPGLGLTVLGELSRQGGAFSGAALEQTVHWWFRRGAYGEIRAAYDATRGERFQNPDRLYYEVGEALYLLGDPAAAEPLLARVAAGPFLPYALHTRALVAFRGGRLDDAVGLLGDAVERAQDGPGVLLDRLRVTRGRVLYQAAVGMDDLDAKRRRNLLEVARKQFEQVGEKRSQYAQAVRGIGWTSLELGEPARALGAFVVASQRDPDGAAEDLWAQGRVYQRTGFHAEAVDAFGLARQKALALAEALEARGDEASPRRPSVREDDVGSLLPRLDRLEARRKRVARALEHRAKRIDNVRHRVDEARVDRDHRLEELDHMAEGLHGYLDGVSVAALVPKSQRGRLDEATALDRRVGDGLDRAGGVIGALEVSARWAETGDALHRRLETLSGRLVAASRAWTDARRAFLSAIKKRVAVREAELSEAIGDTRLRVEGLDRYMTDAASRSDEAGRVVEAALDRLAVLARRLEAARTGAEKLLVEARAGRIRTVVSEARRRAHELRLAADAYELDETQALHLLEEGGAAGRSDGEGPR